MDTDINYIIQNSIKGDKISQEILLNKLHPLIYKNIYKYYQINDDIIEDLVQEGYIIILKSLKTYNENLNVHFLGYVKIKLKYYYKNYYRNTKNQRQTISLDQTVHGANFVHRLEAKTYANSIDPIDKLIKKENNKELQANIKKLSIKEQNVLNMYYIDELSMSEIANQLNIAYRTAIGRKYIAIQKLKKMMGAKIGGEKDG